MIKGHLDIVTSVLFSPDGKNIVTTGLDGTARVWNVTTMQLLFPPLKSEAGVVGAAFSPDGKILITRTVFDENYFWSLETGELVRVAK